MAATVALNEYNTVSETKTADVARADFLSADVASTSTTVRNNNPLTKVAATTVRSYEKWHKLEVTGGTYVQLDTFRHYFDAGLPAGFTAQTSAQSGTPSNETFATPVNSDSTLADTAFPTSDPAAATISGTLTTNTDETGYVVSQLDMDSDTAVGGFNINVIWKWAETT